MSVKFPVYSPKRPAPTEYVFFPIILIIKSLVVRSPENIMIDPAPVGCVGFICPSNRQSIT